MHRVHALYTRTGKNTPSDEYDTYREYRVLNTNNREYSDSLYSLADIILTECASEEEVKNVYLAITCGLHYT